MPRVAALLLLIAAGWSHGEVGSPAIKPARSMAAQTVDGRSQPFERIDAKHLPNAVRVHAKVISGGLPEGEAAFAELRSLGVMTIVSVDAMTPDVPTATKHGLRYVHLPHGYDGVPQRRVEELAKAVRDLDGRVYIHCHHGKHRSPAAASVACVAAGLMPADESVALLEFAGTSPRYRGLYESARSAKPLDASLLDAVQAEFPETAEVPPMAEAMVAIGHTHERLQRIEAAGWRPPADHPDLDAAHEALLIREHFTEMLRADCVRDKSEAFRDLLQESEQAASALEAALRDSDLRSTSGRPLQSVRRHSARLSANCTACHKRLRDVPLTEK